MGTTVKVDYDALKSYLEEYHHNTSRGWCKADGQDWPCDTYRKVYFAVNGKQPLTPLRP